MKGLSAIASVDCPICNQPTSQIYLDNESQIISPSAIGSSRKHTNPGRILRCPRCGFAFRQMRSSPEQLRELYRQMDTRVYESEVRGRKRTATVHFKILQRYIRGGRLLDVGCASGLFLLEAVQAGWNVTGIEPNETLCAQARENLGTGAVVHCATLEMTQLEGCFDAITLWDVLEHVPDPKAFLQQCRILLRSGGYLLLNVPDLDSWPARTFGNRWPLLLPEHLNYFNRESLRFCANQAGLRPVRFGRRQAWFSASYLGYRLSQHGVPGSGWLRQIVRGPLGNITIPVSLGETLAILRTF